MTCHCLWSILMHLTTVSRGCLLVWVTSSEEGSQMNESHLRVASHLGTKAHNIWKLSDYLLVTYKWNKLKFKLTYLSVLPKQEQNVLITILFYVCTSHRCSFFLISITYKILFFHMIQGSLYWISHHPLSSFPLRATSIGRSSFSKLLVHWAIFAGETQKLLCRELRVESLLDFLNG